jgi:hypothetical protein
MSEQTRAEDTDSNSGTDEEQRRHASAEKRRARRTSSEESPRRASSGGSKRTSSAKTSSRSPSAKPSESAESSRSATPTESARSADQTTSGSAGKRVSAVQAVKHAVEQFQTLTGRSPESVVGTRWEDDHWAVRLEVVESRRIPDTADLLAEYAIELDGQGELLAYSRKDRYVRGRPTE